MKKTTIEREQNPSLSDIDISEMMIVAIEAQRAGYPKVQGNPDHIVELCRLARIGLLHEHGPSLDEAEARATALYEDVLALRKHLAEKSKLTKDLAKALEDAVDSLEYVQTAHPEATGRGVRAERIKRAKALFAEAKAAGLV